MGTSVAVHRETMKASLWIVATLGVASAGCESTVSQGAGGAGGAATSSASSTSTGAGGASEFGRGAVKIISTRYQGPAGSKSASDTSVSFSTVVVNPHCATVTRGPCEVTSCMTNPNDPKSALLSGGDVSIAGGSYPISIMPGSDFKYSFNASTTDPYFMGGEAIHFDVAGSSEVPPHQGSVTAPHWVTFLQSFNQVTFSRDQNTELTFTGGGIGDVVVTLDQSNGDGFALQTFSAVCKYDAKGAGLLIPKDVMATFSAPSPYTYSTIQATVESADVVDAGSGSTTFTALVYAIGPDGSPAVGSFSVP